MNRKGDLFMLGLNILFLVAIIMVFWKLSDAFRLQNTGEELGARQTALLQTYATAEGMLLALDTAATSAAYEAQASLVEKGVLDTVHSACGAYGGYTAWTSSDQDCTPAREELDRRFASETLARLQGKLPASFPPMARYTPTVTHEDGLLVLRAATLDRIELPIVTAKEAAQKRAAAAVQDARAATIARGAFAKDTLLPATVSPAQRREPRDTAASRIIIFSSDADASAYTDGETTVHYAIAADGSIVQVVPEAEKAFFCCDGIGIAVQGWSGTTYPRVVALAADIAKRNAIPVENILYRHDITGVQEEGYPEKRKLGADIVSAQHAPEEEPPEETAAPKMAVAWPTTREELTSCWGPRGSLADFHDGIDMPGEGNPVLAYADGTVVKICDEGGRDGCGGYGRYIILSHANGLFTRYSHLASVGVDAGDAVKVGQAIGRIGNAGRSTGPHLDFKVYTSDDFGPDKAKNPLCFFPDDILKNIDQAMRGNCKYAGYRATDPQLKKECAGIGPGFSAQADKGCFTQSVEISAGGDAKVTATLERLQALGIIDAIKEESRDRGVDPNLVIALIATESGGETDYVNSVGAVGIGQIKPAAAADLKRIGVFPEEANAACTCAGTCRAASVPACTGDPRLNPSLGVRGVAAYYALQKTYLESKGHNGLTDMGTFMIASYNQGAGTISKAINAAKSRGISDPKWEDIVHDIPAEGQKYVPNVLAHYASLGGSTPTSFSDVTCPDQQLTVKELGRYSFAPGFTVRVPDALAPVDALAQWVRDTRAACVGEGDNRACLAEREDVAVAGVTFVPCSSVEEHAYVATRYRTFVEDCKANGQDACWCGFDPNRQDVSVRLYGEQADVLIDGAHVGARPLALPVASFAETPDGTSTTGAYSLEVDGGVKTIVRWKSDTPEGSEDAAFEAEDETYDVPGALFGLYKDGSSLTWVADAGDAEMCGVYKTTHLVCARLDTKTYRDGKAEQPVVKLALHLDDTHPPEGVVDAEAIAASYSGVSVGPVRVTFSPSASEDISYYVVACSGISTGDEEKVLGRTSPPLDKRIDETFTVDLSCAGLSSASTVTITAHDISGNAGTPTVVQVKEATSTEGVVAAAT